MNRGAPLERRTPLRAVKELARGAGLARRTGLARTTGLKPQSAKRQAEYRVRRRVAHETFGTQPQCSRPGCSRWADDCHEPLTRARGGSITDPANMRPLCRPCHDELADEPSEAYESGLLKHSWDKPDVEPWVMPVDEQEAS